MAPKRSILNRLERLPSKWEDTWIIEYAAIIFSIACLSTLCIVLIVAEDKLVLRWNGITLNTLVSILATFSELSALFALSSALGQIKWNVFSRGPASLLDFEAIEAASSGAFGSAQLLCQKARSALVYYLRKE